MVETADGRVWLPGVASDEVLLARLGDAELPVEPDGHAFRCWRPLETPP